VRAPPARAGEGLRPRDVCLLGYAPVQLQHHGHACLALCAVVGAREVVPGKGCRYALASGAACGVAVVAHPTLLFVMPFFAVLFAFAHGRRAVAVLAAGAFVEPPDPEGPPTGRSAWRSLSAWAVVGALVVVRVVAHLASLGIDASSGKPAKARQARIALVTTGC